ncbi:MAG: hypothetical protein CBB71_03575 [Rhodopirellula sp. TMED11]|nr:MAG: hypothetical protein CBB71_03575 [Rhodopirellula sp. TMED11]
MTALPVCEVLFADPEAASLQPTDEAFSRDLPCRSGGGWKWGTPALGRLEALAGLFESGACGPMGRLQAIIQ